MDQSARPVFLIVEDEPEVLVSVAMGIADAGFFVHQARDADEARRLLWDHSEIAVLFTDVEMQGATNGLELAHFARRRSTALKIIVTSGRSAIDTSRIPTGAVFIAKPYRIDDVLESARQVSPKASVSNT
jgi:DNA-binding NtrC family response regulator